LPVTEHLIPDVPLPAGATCADAWQSDEPQPSRIIEGTGRKITDHRLTVSSTAVQWADGSIDDGRIECPHIYVSELHNDSPLNSDQARELAAALLEAAAEIDGWVNR
jgi:hypothetical protein